MRQLLSEKKRARPSPAEKSPREREIDSALRAAAGTERFQRMDPVYQLGEYFAKTFDLAGRAAAEKTAGGEGFSPALMNAADMRPHLSMGDAFLKRFSETAFQNGTLGGAILLGQGKAALLSCFSRSGGMAGPTRTESMRRVDEGANRRFLKNSPGETLQNDGEAYGAVALVVDASRQARDVLADLRRAALDSEKHGTGTLRKMYPFLFDGEEKKLLGELREKRMEMLGSGGGQGAEYRAVCRGIDRCEAQIAKKSQMRHEFLARLDGILANARAAEALFQENGFLQEAWALAPDETGEPPGDEDEGGDTGPQE